MRDLLKDQTIWGSSLDVLTLRYTAWLNWRCSACFDELFKKLVHMAVFVMFYAFVFRMGRRSRLSELLPPLDVSSSLQRGYSNNADRLDDQYSSYDMNLEMSSMYNKGRSFETIEFSHHWLFHSWLFSKCTKLKFLKAHHIDWELYLKWTKVMIWYRFGEYSSFY